MRTHPVHVTHLVSGLVFLGIAVTWALQESGVLDFEGDRWVFPLVLVLAGGAGLVASLGRMLRRPDDDTPVQHDLDDLDDPVEDTRVEDPAEPPRT